MGQTSSGPRADTSRNNNFSQCLSCQNPNCYEEVEEGIPPERRGSLDGLAQEFESISEKAKVRINTKKKTNF